LLPFAASRGLGTREISSSCILGGPRAESSATARMCVSSLAYCRRRGPASCRPKRPDPDDARRRYAARGRGRGPRSTRAGPRLLHPQRILEGTAVGLSASTPTNTFASSHRTFTAEAGLAWAWLCRCRTRRDFVWQITPFRPPPAGRRVEAQAKAASARHASWVSQAGRAREEPRRSPRGATSLTKASPRSPLGSRAGRRAPHTQRGLELTRRSEREARPLSVYNLPADEPKRDEPAKAPDERAGGPRRPGPSPLVVGHPAVVVHADVGWCQPAPSDRHPPSPHALIRGCGSVPGAPCRRGAPPWVAEARIAPRLPHRRGAAQAA